MALEALGTSLGRNGSNGHSENGSTPNGKGLLEEYGGEPERRSQ
jgi:hypothetical protein